MVISLIVPVVLYLLFTYLPTYEDGTECCEMSAYKIQMPGNYPEESIQNFTIYLICILNK